MIFKSEEEAIQYGRDNCFSKHQFEMHKILVDGEEKPLILMGTCLVYEDDLWNDMRETLVNLAKIFGIWDEKKFEDHAVDKASELRDSALEWITDSLGYELVEVYDEF